jgi:hypothetical protein
MASVSFSGGARLQAVLRDRAAKIAKGQTLRVGFLETATYPDGTNVAQVAFWNEYGTKNIPPRPFFRQTIAAKSGNWGNALGKALTATKFDTEKALATVGEGIKDQIVNSIVAFSTPKNAQSTVDAKGFDHPLIDTGVMQRSVEYDVQGQS